MSLISKKEVLAKFRMSDAVLKKYIDEGLPAIPQGSRFVFDEDAVASHIEEKFEGLITQLEVGREYTNSEISQIFRCNEQRGMKKSNSYNALVLLTRHDNNLYDDYWNDDVLYYTGMGFEGDQVLEKENKTLKESNENGVTVFLFEGFESHGLIYRGIVKLVDAPFQEEEKDIHRHLRHVWKFPLKLQTKQSYVSEGLIEEEYSRRSGKAKALSDTALKDKAEEASHFNKSSKRQVVSTVHERNAYVRVYSLRRAKGICELCKMPAPFSVNGEPFLESHHIIWLSEGGKDSIENTAAVCPNCHRRLHRLCDPNDVETLRKNVEDDEQQMN